MDCSYRRTKNDFIEFSLRCDDNVPFTCKAEVKVYIGKWNSFKRTICLNDANKSSVLCSSMIWRILFMGDSVVRFEFHIHIISSTRSQPEPIADSNKFATPNNRSDVILKIGEEKVHVSKEFLAIYSPFFENLFFGDYAEKGKEEVEIKDVVHEEFLDLLRSIYLHADITGRTLPHILKLADRFQIECVLRKSEKYLIQSKTFTREENSQFADQYSFYKLSSTSFFLSEKLQLAEQYRLSALREYCLGTCKYMHTLDCLMCTSIYANFSDETKTAISNRKTDLSKINLSELENSMTEFLTRFQSSERRVLFNFATPNNRSDVILKIEDQKLHVSKEFLAIHSPVFEALFFENCADKGKEEVEIKDVVYEEFVDLLHVIYLQADITESTLVHILKVAHRFQMERVLNKSEKCLKKFKGFDVIKKLVLADQYRFTGIIDHFLQRCTSVREIAQLKSSPEYDTLSDATKAAICDRETELEG